MPQVCLVESTAFVFLAILGSTMAWTWQPDLAHLASRTGGTPIADFFFPCEILLAHEADSTDRNAEQAPAG